MKRFFDKLCWWAWNNVGAPPYLENEVFEAVIDFNVPFEERLVHARLDYVHPLVAYCSPSHREGIEEFSIHLAHPWTPFFWRGAMEFLGWKRLEAVDIDELVALATRYPRLQRYFPIAGIRTVHTFHSDDRAESFARFPFLGVCEGNRILGMHDCGESFGETFRFAAVKTKKPD